MSSPRSLFFLTVLIACSCSRLASSVELTLSRTLLDAIRYTDSGGDVCALGDDGGSLGAYKIRHQHYQAAVRGNTTLLAHGEEYKDVWGEGSIRYSEQVMTSYVSRYATSTRLGHVPTDEDIARIHHGGPDGWNDASTLEYWRNVSKAMNLARAVPNGVSTGECSSRCGARQCCDRDEQGIYRCFCLQALVNNHQEFVKRPCENCSHIAGIDIMFVLDSSGSIGSANFQKIRNFVEAVVNDLEIGPTRTQVGVIVFSSSASMAFNLSTYSTREELTSAISRIPYIGGGTDTAAALYLLVNEGFAEARPKIEGVPRIAIVVTDGKSNEPSRTVVAAEVLRQVPSITTYAVGIGNANIQELNTIASKRNGANLTRYISSFDLTELERLQEDLNDQACTASTNVPVEVDPIRREIEDDVKVYLEFSVPEDGFTVKVELEVGRVAVCGSKSLERPDCSYSLTYDWRLEVSEYSELFIGGDGSPWPIASEGTTTPTTTPMPTTTAPNYPPSTSDGDDVTTTNTTVYVTVEGLEANNIFLLNTSYGDTTTVTIKVTDATIAPAVINEEVDNLLYIITAVGGGGLLFLVLTCVLCTCVVCTIRRCAKSRKKLYSYSKMSSNSSSYAV